MYQLEPCAYRRRQPSASWFICRLIFPFAQPFLRQQLGVQVVPDFLLQHNKKRLFIMSELPDMLLAGVDLPQADQPNSLDEGVPHSHISTGTRHGTATEINRKQFPCAFTQAAEYAPVLVQCLDSHVFRVLQMLVAPGERRPLPEESNAAAIQVAHYPASQAKEKENHVGRKDTPHIDKEKGDTQRRGTVHPLHQEEKKGSQASSSGRHAQKSPPTQKGACCVFHL
eukprot:1137964-Pelagomonas_calceolata.AAC.3